MNKFLTFTTLLFLFACSPSEEEVKKMLDGLYSKVRAIPISEPCKNLEGYKKIQSLEDRRGTSYYSEISKGKIDFYKIACSKQLKVIADKKKRQEELNKLGAWSYGNYVDEFGDRTGEGYVGLDTLGTFSNSATTGSSLRVRMYLSNGLLGNPWFRLYEYNSSNPVKGIFSDSNKIKCRVKNNDNVIFPITLWQEQGWDYFYIDGDQKFKNLIPGEGVAKFSCYKERYSSTKYNFALNFQYFSNALRKYKSSR